MQMFQELLNLFICFCIKYYLVVYFINIKEMDLFVGVLFMIFFVFFVWVFFVIGIYYYEQKYEEEN